MKKLNYKRVTRKIGCFMIAGTLAISGWNQTTVMAGAESITDAAVPDYWSGNKRSCILDGVQWEYLSMHYNGPTYGSSQYEPYITNLKLKSVSEKVRDIVIPEMIDGLKVKALGQDAFRECEQMRTVKIPKTIETICDNAFMDCKSLENVEFEDLARVQNIGESIFKNCSSLRGEDFIEELIEQGKLRDRMFENCTAIETVSIRGKNVNIPALAFARCSNLREMRISDEVKSLEIQASAFREAKFEELDFKCKVWMDCDAFGNNWNLRNVIFRKSADIKERAMAYSFKGSTTDSGKKVTFLSGTVSLGDDVFTECTGLEQVEFAKGLKEVQIGSNAFCANPIQSMVVRGNQIEVKNEGLAGLYGLSQLSFEGGNVLLNDMPFYGMYYPSNCGNEKLKTITFDCKTVNYKNDLEDKKNGTFYGLSALREIVCSEKCQSFAAEIRDVSQNDYHKNIHCLKTFYFKNPEIALEQFLDFRKNAESTLYGYQKSTGSYVAEIKTNPEYADRNQQITYQPFKTGLAVSYKGNGVPEGKNIHTEELEVYETYADGSKSENIPYTGAADNGMGYDITKGECQQKENGEIFVEYQISYGGHTCLLPVRQINKVIESFDINYHGGEKIEGETVSESDFSISNIKYSDHSVDEMPKEEIKVTLDDSECLRKGENTIYVTYGEKTLSYVLNAREKKVTNLDICLANEGKKLFEGSFLDKDDFIVTAYFDNGEVAQHYTEYEMDNIVVEREKTEVLFSCGQEKWCYIYEGIPLQVAYLDVSYNGGEIPENSEVDKQNLKVTAVYNNGKEKELNGEAYDLKYDAVKAGKVQTIFVHYAENGIEVEGTFQVIGAGTLVSEEPLASANPIVGTEPPAVLQPSDNLAEATHSNGTQQGETSAGAILQDLPAGEPVISPNASQNTNIQESIEKLSFKKTKYVVGKKEKLKLKVNGGKVKTFLSSNTKVVSVNAKGVITAKKEGKAVITVKDREGKQSKCTIHVKKAPKILYAVCGKKKIKVNKKTTVKPKFEKGYYSHHITYTSNRSKVASVSSKGVVTGKKKGKAIITMETYNHKKVKVIIIVK